MTLLIICGYIIVYCCVGAVVCGVYDEYADIQDYTLFWPFIIIAKTFKKWFGREE